MGNRNSIPDPSLNLHESYIFQQPIIVEQLARLGRASDLHHLRQTSELYYDILSPDYLEMGKLYLKLTKERNLFANTFPPLDVKIRNCFNYKEIDPKTTPWSPAIAKTFRGLCLSNIWSQNMEHTITAFGPVMMFTHLISELCSNITSLDLETVPTTLDFQKPGEKLLEFFTQFQNLKNLKLKYDWEHRRTSDPMTVHDLEFALRNLCLSNKRIKISLQAQTKLVEFLTKFEPLLGSFKNFELSLLVYMNEIGTISQLQLPKGSGLPKAKNLKFFIVLKCLYGLEHLETLISFYSKFGSQIEGLHMTLLLGYNYMGLQPPPAQPFNVDNVPVVRGYLDQLSPITTGLWLQYSRYLGIEDQQKWDVIGADTIWPKVQKLSISRYNQPLEILKNFPNLETLRFNYIDEAHCIFHDVELDDHKALVKYFGTFSKLKELFFRVDRYGFRLAQPEYQALLRKILPQLKKFNFVIPIPSHPSTRTLNYEIHKVNFKVNLVWALILVFSMELTSRLLRT